MSITSTCIDCVVPVFGLMYRVLSSKSVKKRGSTRQFGCRPSLLVKYHDPEHVRLIVCFCHDISRPLRFPAIYWQSIEPIPMSDITNDGRQFNHYCAIFDHQYRRNCQLFFNDHEIKLERIIAPYSNYGIYTHELDGLSSKKALPPFEPRFQMTFLHSVGFPRYAVAFPDNAQMTDVTIWQGALKKETIHQLYCHCLPSELSMQRRLVCGWNGLTPIAYSTIQIDFHFAKPDLKKYSVRNLN